eukprot:6214609-Pleurochrysis_carterae.AAC.1
MKKRLDAALKTYWRLVPPPTVASVLRDRLRASGLFPLASGRNQVKAQARAAATRTQRCNDLRACLYARSHARTSTHARTHARTHSRMHALTHAR